MIKENKGDSMEELNNGIGVSDNQEIDSTADYIDTINKLKANTVDKAQFMKLKEENRKLLDSIVNGQGLEQPKKETKNIEELRRELYGKRDTSMSALQYVSDTLELRKLLMEKGEQDPFVILPGAKARPEPSDFDRAENTARSFQECVDIADGNPTVFNNELSRRLN